MKLSSLRIVWSVMIFFVATGAFAANFPALKGETQFFATPNADGPVEWADVIDQARKSVDMTMYNLTDLRAANPLMNAAKRGVRVRLIVDFKNGSNPKSQKLFDQMKQAGVAFVLSSQGFSLTHSKAMVVDNQVAFITSINLTKIPQMVRDYGIMTKDTGVIREMNSVFEADLKNAKTGSADTPPLQSPNLVWSPVNSKPRLLDLIGSATSTIEASVENLTDGDIVNALAQAQARGVKVRMMVPECSMSGDEFLNYPSMRTLVNGNVAVRVMPAPASPLQPYIHAKMIVADGQTAYVGSENFSYNSLEHARELGVIFTDSQISEQIQSDFNQDWNTGVPMPSTQPSSCHPLPF